MDIVLLLEEDHRQIRKLLARLRNQSTDRAAIYRALRAELESHDAAEEERIYPRIARLLDMKEEAETFLEEHQASRDLMDRLETLNPNGDAWRALAADLSEIVETHLEEEEELLFPQIRKLLSDELRDRLGRELLRAKGSLELAS